MIKVQREDFDVTKELDRLTAGNRDIGGIATFLGVVRASKERIDHRITAMTLEHYPGMTERQLTEIEAEAHKRWPLEETTIIHRYGRLEPGERIATLQAVRQWPEADGERFVVMGTRRGVVKKTDLRAYRHPRADGIIAMSVELDDAVIGAELTDGEGEIFMGTRAGMAIRFREADARPMGRTAQGVRGIALRSEDEVVAMTVVKPGGTLLTVTERGYGKRTKLDEYRVQARGGIGLINIQTSGRNGRVTSVAYVEQDDELMLITEQGKILRMVTGDIRPIGRATQGVCLIEIDDQDRVVSVARLTEKDLVDSETDETDNPGS